MTKRTVIYIVIGWFVLTVVEYYNIPYFIKPILWLLLSLGLFILAIIQLIKLFKDQKQLSKIRVFNCIIFSILFYLTFNPKPINRLIEKIDWKIFYNKRMEIVDRVKRKELNPNVSWNNWVCKLPFSFPVISNGGNDIGINRNQKTNTVTVNFWIYRAFFNNPSTYFIYTNDNEEIKQLEIQIANDPKHNWKIQDNWYRALAD